VPNDIVAGSTVFPSVETNDGPYSSCASSERRAGLAEPSRLIVCVREIEEEGKDMVSLKTSVLGSMLPLHLTCFYWMFI
jgi:hypothetical protein